MAEALAGNDVLADIRLGSALDGKTLNEAQLSGRGITAVLLKRSVGDRTEVEGINPGLRLAAGDQLSVVGERKKIGKFERECGVQEPAAGS